MTAVRLWTHKEVWQGEDFYLLSRIQGLDAANLQEADVSNIQVWIYQDPDLLLLFSDITLSPSAGTDANTRVYDALQTDAKWDEDDTGYNLLHLVKWDDMTTEYEGGFGLRIEIALELASPTGAILYDVHRVPVKSMIHLAAS